MEELRKLEQSARQYQQEVSIRRNYYADSTVSWAHPQSAGRVPRQT